MMVPTDECPIICDQIAKGDSRFVVIHQNNQGFTLMARRNGLQIFEEVYIVHVIRTMYAPKIY